MSPLVQTHQWAARYAAALSAKSIDHEVGPFNDITVTLGDGGRYVIRNTATVVPQRLHMLGYPSSSISVENPVALERAAVRQQFDDMTIRARGRALQDHAGQVYFEVVCVAGEPGEVPGQERLERIIPQLFVLMAQMHQRLEA